LLFAIMSETRKKSRKHRSSDDLSELTSIEKNNCEISSISLSNKKRNINGYASCLF